MGLGACEHDGGPAHGRSVRRSAFRGTAALVLALATETAAQSANFSADLDAVLSPASPPPFASIAPEASGRLYLGVELNGQNSDVLIEAVADPATGQLAVVAEDLRSAGIRPPAGAQGLVPIDAIPGATVDIDLLAQMMRVSATDIALMPRILRPMPRAEILPAEPGYGLVLNYRLNADLGSGLFRARPGSGYLALDGRAFMPLGVLRTTAGISFTDFSPDDAKLRRFDTTFTVAIPKRNTLVVLGDMVTGGASWARPVRFGGIQIRRDFSMRDDIVTAPSLTFEGTAAVPSKVDVYVGSVRAFTGAVEPGPFVVTDLPFITSDGIAEVIIRDEAGSEQVTRVPFFASRDLLRSGMLDFALQLGRPRQNYGIENLAYGNTIAGVASLRYGFTDRITLEAHLEGNNDVLAGGLGLASVLFNRAEVSFAVGASRQGEARGMIAETRFRTSIRGLNFNMSSRRTFGDFRDLAYASGVDMLGPGATAEEAFALRPANVLDVVSIGIPLFDKASFGVSFINYERGDTRDRILSASYSHQLGQRGASLDLSGFRAFGSDGGYGLSLGVSMQFGGARSGSFDVTRGSNGPSTRIGMARPLGNQTGDTGYSVTVSGTGADRSGDLRLAHNTRFGRAELWASSSGDRATAQAAFDGAFVVAGGGVFATSQIADAFAVVDVGLPGIGISLQNRPVAFTGTSGRAIVPGLRSYRRNRIAIELNDDLPLDLGITATARDVVPALNAGVVLDFGASAGRSALVVLRNSGGAYLEAGSVAVLNGGEEAFVGYDGLVWFTELRRENTVTVHTSDRTCTARFVFSHRPGEQQIIDPVECSP